MEKRTIVWLISIAIIIVAAVILLRFVKTWGSREFVCQTGCATNWAENTTKTPKTATY